MVSNPLLLNVFQELDKAGIRYGLLRGLDELALNTADCEIDLLIDPAHINLFKQVVFQLGFVPMPSWGHAPHTFFLAYDEDTHDMFINIAEEENWAIGPLNTELIVGTALRLVRALAF